MSERSLSRRVAVSVVDALKAQGHVLLVKGGTEALVRELNALMAAQLARVSSQISPGIVVGEVTSTFGNEAIDDEVEVLVDRLAQALMDSDHVEDVFAEDRVIRRDIFRCVRDTLLKVPEAEPEEVDDLGPISVRLDQLGYVAATVARRADDATLREALERAAAAAEGQLASYDLTTRAAVFHVTTDDPDARLEIEEAVEDELVGLADDGIVELPAVERRVALSRAPSARERAELGPLAETSLGRLGIPATWELDGASIRLRFTPLSDQDAQQIDAHAQGFAAAVGQLLGAAQPPSHPSEAPPSRRPRVTTDDGERASAPAKASERGASSEASPGRRARPPTAKKTAAATATVRKTSVKSAPPRTVRKTAAAKRSTKRPS